MDRRVFTFVGLDEIVSVDVDCVGGWLFSTSSVDVRLELIQIIVGIGLGKDDIWEDVVCVDTVSSAEFEMFSFIFKLDIKNILLFED